MDSGEQDTRAIGLGVIQEDDREDEQQVQQNTMEVEENANEVSDSELESEDVQLGGQRQENVARGITLTSQFSDSSSDEGEEPSQQAEVEEERDAASDSSSEYDDIEAEIAEGRLPPRPDGSAFEGFDGSYAQLHGYGDEIPAHPESQDDDGSEEPEHHYPKPGADEPEFSPRTKHRIKAEESKGFLYKARPKGLADLRTFLWINGREGDMDDPVYRPDYAGRGRDRSEIQDDRERMFAMIKDNVPLTPSALNPRREDVNELLRSFAAGHDGVEDASGDSETRGRDSPVSPLLDAEDAGEAVISPVEPSSEQQDTTDNSVSGGGSSKYDSGAHIQESITRLSWDDVRSLGTTGANFADDEDDEDFRQLVDAVQRRNTETSESRQSSAESIELLRVTLASSQSRDTEQGESEEDPSEESTSATETGNVPAEATPGGTKSEGRTQSSRPRANTLPQETAFERVVAPTPPPASPLSWPQPTISVPSTRPTVNLPTPRQSNGMAYSMWADEHFEPTPPTSEEQEPATPVESQTGEEHLTPAVEKKITIKIPALKRSRRDSATETDNQPEKKAKTQQRPQIAVDNKNYLAVIEKYIKDAKGFERDARHFHGESQRLRRERNEFAARHEAAHGVAGERGAQIKDLKEEIEMWRDLLHESDENFNDAKEKIRELEEESSNKCDDCVRNGGATASGSAEEVTGDIEDFPKPKDGECCKGRWAILERELAEQKTRAGDLQEEKKRLEKKLEKVKQQANEAIERTARGWSERLDETNEKWQKYADKNRDAAERERQRKEAEYVYYLPRLLDLDDAD